MKNKKYNIGKIADSVGLSKQTIRNYEEHGIIDGGRNKRNKYREYDTDDAKILFQTKLYRSLGFTLEEIVHMLYESDEKDILSTMSGKRAEVLDEFKTVQKRLEELYDYETKASFAIDNLNKMAIQKSKKTFFLVLKSDSGMDILNKDDVNVIESQNYLPMIRQGFSITRDENGDIGNIRYGSWVDIENMSAEMMLTLKPVCIQDDCLWADYYDCVKNESRRFENAIKHYVSLVKGKGYNIVSEIYVRALLQTAGENGKVYYQITSKVSEK